MAFFLFQNLLKGKEKAMELFKILGTVAIDNTGANASLDKTGEKASGLQHKMGVAFANIGSAAVAVGKTIATGLAVGTAAMGALTVKALSLGGELEQNMGGSEAVFAEYAKKMQDTAKTAFGSMGLSASDFLATANKMGALFKGAGFEVEEASDITVEAMQRAADVASIMGIDVSVAMESIAGAAKGNFTMMDNLGVAINDTTLQNYALEKGIEKSTQEMTTQEKVALALELFMDRTAYATGNYAKENDTLAGSLTTAKAALENFLTGAGDVDSLVDALMNASDVIIKKITELAPRLVSGVSDLVSKLTARLPEIIGSLLPPIITGAVDLMNGLVDAFPDLFAVLVDAAPQFIEGIEQIFLTIIDALPGMMEMFSDALPELVQLITEKIPTLIPQLLDSVLSALSTLVDSLVEIMPTLAPQLFDALLAIGTTLMERLPEIITPLMEKASLLLVYEVPRVMKNLVDALIKNLPTLIEGAAQLISGLISAGAELAEKLTDLLPYIVDGIVLLIEQIAEQLPDLLNELVPALIDCADDLMSAMIDAITKLIPALVNAFGKLVTESGAALATVGGLVSAFKGFAMGGPVGIAIGVIGSLAGALGFLASASTDVLEPAYELTEAEALMRDRAEKAAQAHSDLVAEYERDAGDIEAEKQRTYDLWQELQNLVDANGKVKEGCEKRAQFIANELEEATGKEINLIDGTIQKYDELAASIEGAILLRQNEALLTNYENVYNEAITGMADAESWMLSQKAELDAIVASRVGFEKELAALRLEYGEAIAAFEAGEYYGTLDVQEIIDKENELLRSISQRKNEEIAAQQAYDDACDDYFAKQEAKMTYEEAYAEMLAGNHEASIAYLTGENELSLRSLAYKEERTERELELVREELNEALKLREAYYDEIEKGSGRVSDAMLADVNSTIDMCVDILQGVVYEAEEVGGNIATGIAKGMKAKEFELYGSVAQTVTGVVDTMKKVAQIASPSKVTQQIGEFLSEGLSVGIENKQDQPIASAYDAMQSTISAFSANTGTGESTEVSGDTMESENAQKIEELKRSFEIFAANLPEMLTEAFASMRFDINNREFARMVKAVN